MLPAQQRLDRDDAQVIQAIAWLVVQHEFVLFDGAAQVVLSWRRYWICWFISGEK
jgi:hypothetical protein